MPSFPTPSERHLNASATVMFPLVIVSLIVPDGTTDASNGLSLAVGVVFATYRYESERMFPSFISLCSSRVSCASSKNTSLLTAIMSSAFKLYPDNTFSSIMCFKSSICAKTVSSSAIEESIILAS